MTHVEILTALWTAVFFLIHLGVIARVILRPHREPASRIAWIVVIIVVPVIGILAYIFLGETNIGRRRVSRICAVLATMPDLTKAPGMDAPNVQPKIPETYAHLFRLGHSVNGFEPVGANCASLLADSNAAIESMVADIDASQDHVHLTFYIWLPDNNGLKVVEALKRAAARKVTCRAMADGLGSRIMIESPHWKAMEAAGVQVATALPIGNLVVRADTGIGMGVGATGTVMWFNTIVQSAASGFNIGNSTTNDLRNNISAFNGAYAIVATDAKFTQQDYNGLFSNASGPCTVCTPGTHSVLLDPKFVSLASDDYTLQSSSPMINAGVAVGFDRNGSKAGDFDGTAPDLGFWESP